ncbi:hypothetical protein Aph02nite_43740 [Actinoplanes philippinensis]|uniref:Calcineurin-like phosphoesterase n=1 Tax=Actinoplanes philippinensis TaxID=35752 RepID=A0A1I2IE28_9ACTN|nr:hypothetical protein Aph02nite_43740 [Actinoplanes philippinensis]SFF39347.1 Calcineurin-like phosphoesterase [Actinoplanes philippinensis]
MPASTLFAISDLHVGHPENREIVESLHPDGDGDRLIVAGDVGEMFADVVWALRLLAGRFAKVIWAPGNHELWTPREDPVQWCWERVALTGKRLDAVPAGLPTVLINHWPMVREPTRILRFPEFAQCCGTELTADWHVRYRAAASVYGHLHIPRTTYYDGGALRGGVGRLSAGVAPARHPAGAPAPDPRLSGSHRVADQGSRT